MRINIDITNILKTVFENSPKEQVGIISCYLGTVGAGIIVYKLKLDHDYRMAALNAA